MAPPITPVARAPISVMIRTQNNLSTLPRVLARLGLQPEDELIAVDTASHDGTRDYLRAQGARIVPWEKPFHLVATLNRGLAEARHPWVLTLSSHSVPLAPSLLDAYRDALPQLPANTFAAFGPSLWITRHWRQREGITVHDLASFHRGGLTVGASNLLVRRSAWVDLPFDESLACEDQVWIDDQLSAGRVLVHVHAAASIYGSLRSPRHLYRKGHREFLANQTVLFLEPPRWHNLALQAAHLSRWVLRGDISPGRALRAMSYSVGHWTGGREWKRRVRAGLDLPQAVLPAQPKFPVDPRRAGL